MPHGDRDPFDPDGLRLNQSIPPYQLKPKLPRHRQGQKFLKGPIPWTWLACACRLRGKAAIVVALILWQEAGCRKSSTVTFRNCQARELRMKRQATRRGLKALEAAKLIAVQRKPGRCLEVTLLDRGIT